MKVSKRDRDITFDIYDDDYNEHLENGGNESNYVPSDGLGDRKNAIDSTK